MSRGTWVLDQQVLCRVAYRALTVYGRLFQNRSTTVEIGNLRLEIGFQGIRSRDTNGATRLRYHTPLV